MHLKTYRNYLLFNKFLDLIIYLVIFTIITTFSFMIYYTTESFIILFALMIIIYVIGLLIAKLFEIKILLPSIVYILISLSLVIMISYFEKETINSDLFEFSLIILLILTIAALIITVYKYETPISIYYKIKDYFSGLAFGKKIKIKYKKIKNHNTITPYSTNLIFEKNKLLHKLNEEFKEKNNDIENEYIKFFDNFEIETDELNDLENQLEVIEKRLKKKNTGAQDYELCNQRKEIKEKIKKQKETVVNLNIKVNTLKNNKEELKNTYDKNNYYISNAYNIRYINYANAINEKLSLTRFNLEIVPFDSLTKNLEE